MGTAKVSVIIPTRNEESNLTRILEQLPAVVDEVIVVDGNSTDGTQTVAKNHPRVDKLLVQRAKGKGAALSLGMRHCSGDYIINLDADGSMSPAEIPLFIAALDLGADLARGSRYLPGAGSTDLTAFRSIGNKALTGIANVLFGQKWTDVTYGYAAFRRSHLEQMDVFYFDNKVNSHAVGRRMSYGQGFEIECLIFCRSVRRGLKVVEVASIEEPRWDGASNLQAIPDGARSLAAILVERMRSRRLPHDDIHQ